MRTQKNLFVSMAFFFLLLFFNSNVYASDCYSLSQQSECYSKCGSSCFQKFISFCCLDSCSYSDISSCNAACELSARRTCSNGSYIWCCPDVAPTPADPEASPTPADPDAPPTPADPEVPPTSALPSSTPIPTSTPIPPCGAPSYHSFDQAALPTAGSLTGRLKQTLVTENGLIAYYRYGTWDPNGTSDGRQGVYSNWTSWSSLNLSTLQVSGQTTFRSFTHTMLPYNPAVIKQTLVASNGANAYYRYGTWNGSDFGGWTAWSNLNLGTLVSGQSSFQFMDQAVLPTKDSPTGRFKQTLVSEDGRMAYYRYGTWDPNGTSDGRPGVYSNWTSWSSLDLSTLVPGTFRSFTHTMLPYNPLVLKQTLVTMDGKTAYYRYGTWNGTDFAGWTSWASMSLVNFVTCSSVSTPTPAGSCSKKNQGDADCNGTVDNNDYAIWKGEYLSVRNRADFNNDGKVDLADFEIWRRNISK